MSKYDSELIMCLFSDGHSIEQVAWHFGLPRKDVEDVLITNCLSGRLQEFYEPEELVA